MEIELQAGEQIKPISSAPGYLITSYGRVYSMKSNMWMELGFHRHGYYQVNLRVDGKQKTFLVHRLVAEAFIENPDPEHFTLINHKDEDKKNNRVENLEWCDYKYNINYGTCLERMVKSKAERTIPTKGRPIAMYDLKTGERLQTFPSVREASMFIKGDFSGLGSIRRCAIGGQTMAYGYYWHFLPKEKEKQ